MLPLSVPSICSHKELKTPITKDTPRGAPPPDPSSRRSLRRGSLCWTVAPAAWTKALPASGPSQTRTGAHAVARPRLAAARLQRLPSLRACACACRPRDRTPGRDPSSEVSCVAEESPPARNPVSSSAE